MAKDKKSRFRINQQIRAPKVRLIHEKENDVVELKIALDKAKDLGLDLVEVGAAAKPPVVKLMDYKRFLFEAAEKQKKADKSKKTGLKELRFRPRIGDRDLGIRIDKARKFLEKGYQVKFNVFFYGRERAHPKVGEEKLERVLKQLTDISKVENKPKKIGNVLTVVLVPKRR